MPTYGDILERRLRHEPGRPLITFYDDSTGERVELSVTTYANWVAKAAALVVDELGLERGDTMRIDLPPHWLGTVFLGAAWRTGLVVVDDDAPDVVVCGPATLGGWAEQATDRIVLACALLPLGVRFAAPVPQGVHDVGVDIWSQPDAFVPWDAPSSDDPAVDLDGVRRSHGELWRTAAAGRVVSDGGRLLSAANPASPTGLATFTEPFARNGSLVLVTQAGRERLESIATAEHATARFPT